MTKAALVTMTAAAMVAACSPGYGRRVVHVPEEPIGEATVTSAPAPALAPLVVEAKPDTSDPWAEPAAEEPAPPAEPPVAPASVLDLKN